MGGVYVVESVGFESGFRRGVSSRRGDRRALRGLQRSGVGRGRLGERMERLEMGEVGDGEKLGRESGRKSRAAGPYPPGIPGRQLLEIGLEVIAFAQWVTGCDTLP